MDPIFCTLMSIGEGHIFGVVCNYILIIGLLGIFSTPEVIFLHKSLNQSTRLLALQEVLESFTYGDENYHVHNDLN